MKQFQFTDGNLLQKFKNGDRVTISAVCLASAQRIKSGGLVDEEVISLLADALERIGNGEEPNKAFGWDQPRKGRLKETHTLRDWEIKKSVQERMIATGESLRAACAAVCGTSGKFNLGHKTIESVCNNLTADTPLPMPDDIFPLEDCRRYLNKEHWPVTYNTPEIK